MERPPVDEPKRRGGPQKIPRPPGAVRPGAPAPWAELPEGARHPTVGDVRRALARLAPAVPSPVERGGFGADRFLVRGRSDLLPGGGVASPSPGLAPLYDHDGEAWVVLTRRSRALRAHAGEVSFPGGRAEPSDHDLVATALREAQEEIGLDPGAVEIVGELDHLATVSSGSFIVPWVGAVAGGRPELLPSSGEVDAVLHVPLSELMAPGVFWEEHWSFGPAVSRPIVFFDVVGDTIWGATAAMLRQLLGLVTGTLPRGDLRRD